MSETVHYKGKLEIVKKLDNETLENQCKRLFNGRLSARSSFKI
jgi:hypothetical protein